MLQIKNLPVFATINYGKYKTASGLHAELKLISCPMGEYMDGAFYKITPHTKRKLNLVELSLEQLGFSVEESISENWFNFPTINYGKIMIAGLKLGLELCPQDTAPLIILNHKSKLSDFSESTSLVPIMIPIMSDTFEPLPMIAEIRMYRQREKLELGLWSWFVLSKKNGLKRGVRCLFVRP